MDNQQIEAIINRLDKIDDRLIALSDKLGDVIEAINKVDEHFDVVSNIQTTLESIESIIDSRLK